MGLGAAQKPLIKAGAVGALIVMPLSFDALSGVYTFGVPALHQMPSLYLDRDAGRADCRGRERRQAALRCGSLHKTEEAEAYQLFGYLPGRDYGKPDDQQVMLITHTDGPSISQENGAMGILVGGEIFFAHPAGRAPAHA